MAVSGSSINQTGTGLRIGTRGSPLALTQAEMVKAALVAAHPGLAAESLEIVPIRTTGDKVQDRTLATIGGKGLFTKEIEEALIDGRVDLAVHSMKDMPTFLPDGLTIAAMLEREDPRDALISPVANSIVTLPRGAVVGTASLRRQAQLLMLRPDLKVQPLRGNVGTRLEKLARGEAAATLLALAGLKRLGRAEAATAILSTDEMLPAVAQGAIGVEIRANDARVRPLVEALDHAPTSIAVAAERACLAELDGSCRTPIAAYAEISGTALRLRGLIALPDGTESHRAEDRGRATRDDAAALGRALGQKLKALAGPHFLA
ncbi:MAG TPA: hydroxymethylbilane synthase [Candidatus Binatia bacterium]|nr:hydroxymethylbilane synthase [Candidatus Binatia bacterium]